MGICAVELREYVIRPTLEHFNEWSLAAENLLIGTAIQESGLGFHIKQQLDGRIGIYQIDAATHSRIWDEYLAYIPDLASTVRGIASQHGFLQQPHIELATNLKYATAIAWLIYREKDQQLPLDNDIEGLARYWQENYHRCSPAEFEPALDGFIKNYLLHHNKDLAA